MIPAVVSFAIPVPQTSCEMPPPLGVHHQCSRVPPLPRRNACCSPLSVTNTLGRPTTPEPHVSCCTPFVLGPQYQCCRLPPPSTAHASWKSSMARALGSPASPEPHVSCEMP